jgi:actin-related protein
MDGTGISLILSMVCVNGASCEAESQPPGVNYVENIVDNDHKQNLEELAKQLKGKTLKVVTLEDYPLSYYERSADNTTLRGKGRAFEFFEILMKKYDFNYTIVKPQRNEIGYIGNSDGTLLSVLEKKVRKLI